ncbi:MAG: PqqD family protein [Bacteroidales bacterium]|nr:PqqD family protein [Candidatus Cacconaster merdequi]
MKQIEGFKMRQLGREYIIVGEGIKLVNFNKMIVLNGSAAYLWRSVEGQEFDVEKLKSLLLEEYDVSEEVAAQDAAKVAKSWIEAGIVEE